MSSSRLLGTYLLGVEPLLVVEHDGGLALAMLGVPPDFVAPLVPDGDSFRVSRGELAGAEV